MNSDNLLSLIADLYGQIVTLQAENSRLAQALAAATADEPANPS